MAEERNNKPAEMLAVVLAKTVVMAYHAQVAHWNFMGPIFPAYHKFFGKLYEELADAVDVIAEDLRTLREFPDDTLGELLRHAGQESPSDPANPFKRLAADNEEILLLLTDVLPEAERWHFYGVANNVQNRLSAHEKIGWMLRASQAK